MAEQTVPEPVVATTQEIRRRIAVGHLERCGECSGLGWIGHWFGGPLYRLDTCPECKGRGKTVVFAAWERGRA